jgi:uncharacterized repeat protein (TIGR01451 family)
VLPTTTVINVDSVTLYDAAYAGGSAVVSAQSGTTVYVRAVVSDPFGSFDITGATLTVTDYQGAVRLNAAPMVQVADTGALTKTYEYAYPVPAGGPAGNWTFRVTGLEGTEGTVTDMAQTGLNIIIPMPNITVVKSVIAYSDPVNGTTGPKAIPGAHMQYTVLATNTGEGVAQGVTVTDPIPANTELYVGDLAGVGSGPVGFSDGAVPSGLACVFGGLSNIFDSISFSHDGGTTYTYVPVPDPDGFDANVTNIRVSLGGTFNAASAGNNPSFSLFFRVRVK